MNRKPLKSSLRNAILAVLGTALSCHAWADFYCTVNVIAVLPYNTGAVNVLHSGRGDFTYICNLTGTHTSGSSVQPETCAMWVAILLRAKKDNTTVNFWFPGSGSCATLPTYSNAPVPTYIGPAQ
jgi:hypothetical protein